MSRGGYFNFALYIPAKHASVLFVWTDARIEINGVVLSTLANKAALKAAVAQFDTTRVGDLYHGRGAALRDWSLDLAMWQDLSVGDPAVFPILGSMVTAKLRPTSAPVSVANPEYAGSGLVTEYRVLDSAAGDVAASGLTVKGAGVLVRTIAPTAVLPSPGLFPSPSLFAHG